MKTENIEMEVTSLKGVCAFFGGKSTQWVYDQMRRDSAFPRPLKLSRFSNVWRLSELRAYIDALPRVELSGLSGPQRRVAERNAT